MLLFLIYYLEKFLGIKAPQVFSYISTRMILAALTSLALTIFLGPFFIRKLYELNIGQPLRDEKECPFLAELHEKKKNTPTMGGLLILFAMISSLVLWMDWTSIFTLILLCTALWLGFVGGLDDFLKLKYRNSLGLRPKLKFLLQFSFAFLLAFYLLTPSLSSALELKNGAFTPPVAKEHVKSSDNKKIYVKNLTTQEYLGRVYIPFMKNPLFILKGAALFFAFLSILFVLIGSSNAVNLTDGLDGLAAGCLILVSSVLALFAFLSNHIDLSRYLHILYIEGSGEIAIFLFALAGASLGFLWYNGYPAQIFMGDVGSLSLGGILGVSAVLLRRELLLSLVGGIFVAEALSVILQVLSYRYRAKKRVFLCAPLHHHFEYNGWPETKVVLRFWIIGLFLAILGIASLKFQ